MKGPDTEYDVAERVVKEAEMRVSKTKAAYKDARIARDRAQGNLAAIRNRFEAAIEKEMKS